MAKCVKCGGCGRVADTEDQEPWSVWLALPVGASAAVLSGVVKPITCPVCGGAGQQPEKQRTDLDRKIELFKLRLPELCREFEVTIGARRDGTTVIVFQGHLVNLVFEEVDWNGFRGLKMA